MSKTKEQKAKEHAEKVKALKALKLKNSVAANDKG